MLGLMPRETSFFDLFERAAANVREGTKALVDMMGHFDDVAARVEKIKEIEHRGDEITHQAMESLNKTFVTPLDREDIHRLVSRLDDVLDLTDAAANRLLLYRVAGVTPEARALADILDRSAEIIERAMKELRRLKKPGHLLQLCVDLHTRENEGDRIERQALAGLFDGTRDPYEVIKWKDIYEILEAATDRCEDVANVVEAIVLKNA